MAVAATAGWRGWKWEGGFVANNSILSTQLSTASRGRSCKRSPIICLFKTLSYAFCQQDIFLEWSSEIINTKIPPTIFTQSLPGYCMFLAERVHFKGAFLSCMSKMMKVSWVFHGFSNNSCVKLRPDSSGQTLVAGNWSVFSCLTNKLPT